MKEMDCPLCGNRAAVVLSLHCCVHCGWNVNRARNTVQQHKLFPHIWIGLVSLFFVVLMLDTGANSRTSVTLFCFALAAVGFLPRRKLERARLVLANNSGEVSPNVVESAALRLQRGWEWLLKTSPPREFRLTNRGRRNLVRGILSILFINAMFVLCIAGNYWVLHKKHGPFAGELLRPLLIFTVVMAAIYTIFFSALLIIYHSKARRLLAGGQAVIGKIVRLGSASSDRTLNLEFPHPLGSMAKAKVAVRSEAYFEGMTLPVFCNTLNLKDNLVFFEGGDYEIPRPGLSNPPL